jgi:hypothetical protein
MSPDDLMANLRWFTVPDGIKTGVELKPGQERLTPDYRWSREKQKPVAIVDSAM